MDHAVSLLIATLLVIWLWLVMFRRRERAGKRSIAILVLGDIGRSPRMMYHAESFATHDFETYLIGYRGSRPIPSLLEIPHVRFMYLTELPKTFKRLPFLLLAPLKVLQQIVSIFWKIFMSLPHPPEFIMVQNPPSIPTLAIVWIVCKITGSKLIIDWHNLGYSILALRLRDNHILVKIAKIFEKTFGRTAHIHLFVTKAMRDRLVREWDLQGIKVVLHDRPPAHFHRASAFETHDLLIRMRASFSSRSLTSFLPEFSPPESTPFTHIDLKSPSSSQSFLQNSDPVFSSTINSPNPELREDRPALLVSSTSWTPDEDFGMLLKALSLYEKRAKAVNEQRKVGSDGDVVPKPLPKLVMIVTGKGPLREKYMAEVMNLEKEESWQWVRCRSLWLEAVDYPLLLGSADLGICLHSSSSALDLPMKVVDMFGCGLPVCALDFKCLSELVRHNENGLVFKSAVELAEQMETLLTGFPHPPKLGKLRESLVRKSRRVGRTKQADEWEWCSWAENWDDVLYPLISYG
ncbi:mannosyltransferase [Rickenella mellea]|uniref:Chitobiosyldiphosphodolichol beta-mannosyltransferase n=1 Tax=Rickenella mellea TaxID=50990 RepID=A0A4Y7QNI1_9AGAM|nr:mannosyltransferase [Rickenella mellea]